MTIYHTFGLYYGLARGKNRKIYFSRGSNRTEVINDLIHQIYAQI